MRTETVDLPPLDLRAELSSYNEEQRTVDLIFSTGAGVERMDWASGQRYLEKLEISTAAVDMSRMNAGAAPLLDSHSAWSIADQIGAVVPGSARIENGKAIATVKFSARATVAPILQDVRDGIIRSVSVGYRVNKYEQTEPRNGQPVVRTATNWTPYEVSLVSMPADAGARVRGDDKSNTNACVIITRDSSQEQTMPEQPRSETIAEQPITTQTRNAAVAEPLTPNEHDAGVTAERTRIQGITLACRAARLPQSFADRLVKDGTALVDAQTQIFQELAARGAQDRGPSAAPSGMRVEMSEDPLVHVRAGIENALLHRMHPHQPASGKTPARGFELTEEGRLYRGMTILDAGRRFLEARSVRTTGMSKMDLAGALLGFRAGYHSTSDFANILADLPNKILRQAYLEAPQTFSPIVRNMTLADFKKARLLQLGEAPALLQVGEHGEYVDGSIGESKEEIQLTTWGRKFSITRQALVNDDTDAFSRVPMAFGRQARNKESDLVWAEITNNANMNDGIALFNASHNNLSGTSDAISVAALGTARTAMRRQTGIDGVTLMNLNPITLIVSATKETIADQFVSQNLLASQSSSVNPFAGKLNVVAEPRLDVNSTTAWYLAASTDQIDIVVLATLEGENGPRVDSRVGFDVDGIEIKISHDIAAKAVDFRGLYKNPGA